MKQQVHRPDRWVLFPPGAQIRGAAARAVRVKLFSGPATLVLQVHDWGSPGPRFECSGPAILVLRDRDLGNLGPELVELNTAIVSLFVTVLLLYDFLNVQRRPSIKSFTLKYNQ